MAIPRHIHHIWVGPQPVPEQWAARWIAKHPGWRYTLWRETDIEPLLTPGLRRPWEYYRSVPRWHGMADIARVAILLELGGVYTDIDSEPVRSFEGAPFMRGSFFAGLSDGTPKLPLWVNNGTLGAVAGHPILVTYEALIAGTDTYDPPWNTVGGKMLTDAVLANLQEPGVRILPSRVFYPEGKNGERTPGWSRVYTRHYWATTHKLYRHEAEPWQALVRRRRGKLPLAPPLRERVTAGVGRTLGRLPRPPVRRLFRRLVPRPLRRLARGAVRRAVRAVRAVRIASRTRPPRGNA